MDTRKIGDLTPYDKNPRKNEAAVSYVLESLNRHGQVKPIVVSAVGKPFKQEVICAGHTTFEALKRFGAKEAKVVVKEFADEAQFVDYNIRDNKTSEFAEWDESMLLELASEFDFNLDEAGFSRFEDVDYSILDDDEDDEDISQMSESVMRSIKIEFSPDDYEHAKKLVEDARGNGVNVGKVLVEALEK